MFEALIGAIYLDLGLVHAKRFILNIFEKLNIDLENDLVNSKDLLLQLIQSRHEGVPEYSMEVSLAQALVE